MRYLKKIKVAFNFVNGRQKNMTNYEFKMYMKRIYNKSTAVFTFVELMLSFTPPHNEFKL